LIPRCLRNSCNAPYILRQNASVRLRDNVKVLVVVCVPFAPLVTGAIFFAAFFQTAFFGIIEAV